MEVEIMTDNEILKFWLLCEGQGMDAVIEFARAIEASSADKLARKKVIKENMLARERAGSNYWNSLPDAKPTIKATVHNALKQPETLTKRTLTLTATFKYKTLLPAPVMEKLFRSMLDAKYLSALVDIKITEDKK